MHYCNNSCPLCYILQCLPTVVELHFTIAYLPSRPTHFSDVNGKDCTLPTENITLR